ncbi:hypothetical protein Salat_0705200 [Sesamum alatum]|uniref:Uncharacterized protein n=1 Tax=Sesamum alatum TaxID=300844 RepID=A0AAE1YTI1_9LAMI|nr:hypothetical protein Salat_0705200 [Sesamum alatum]
MAERFGGGGRWRAPGIRGWRERQPRAPSSNSVPVRLGVMRYYIGVDASSRSEGEGTGPKATKGGARHQSGCRRKSNRVEVDAAVNQHKERGPRSIVSEPPVKR